MNPKTDTISAIAPEPDVREVSQATKSNDKERDLALDFTKGILVLFMILYHWINYFVVSEGYIYRYLRFITPSFIFLTGFLIANIYLIKYPIHDLRLHKRLVQRGAKLIGLFTLLNLAAHLFLSQNYNGSKLGLGRFSENLFSIYVIGDGRAAVFEVLVPISYLLLLAAPLLFVCRWTKWAFHLAFGASFLAVIILGQYGVLVPNLELLTIGLLGVVCGYFPRRILDGFGAYMPTILLAYGLYLVAISIWNVIFVLQVVGVCLSLILIYFTGTRIRSEGSAQERILMLGRYSLLAYVAQIILLQFLLRLLRPIGFGPAMLLISLVTLLALTHLTLVFVEFGRRRSKPFDDLYRTVFA